MPLLHVHDETTAGDRTDDIVLEFLTESITVRELIRSRVYQEVQDYNRAGEGKAFRGLVQPTQLERDLNGPRQSRIREIDWKPQFEIACEAFTTNRVLILIDDRQAQSLDEEIVIGPRTEVAFLKLVPLVGG